MVAYTDISVVIQGAVSDSTSALINSIKKKMPGAEIVLSTWEGAVVAGMDCDRIIFNKDPGAVSASTDNRRKFNLNRQIISSKNGVLAATRPYILKCRSDIELTGTDFLSFWDAYPKRDAEYSFARHKIMIPSLYTIKGETEGNRFHPTPFHISDWYAFGLKEDIVELFSVPTVDNEDFSRYYLRHEKPRDYNILWLNERYWQYPPEQYLGVTYAKKKLRDLDFPSCLDYDRVDFEAAERFMVNNFTIVEPQDFKLLLKKDIYYDMSRNLSCCPEHVRKTIYSRYLYEYDYKKYCDADFVIHSKPLNGADDDRYLGGIFGSYKSAISLSKQREYDYAIVTPTFSGHFCYIEKYLKSFCRFVRDKDKLPIYFTVSRNEFTGFCKTVAQFSDEARIHVLAFEDVLEKYGIQADPDRLLSKYGRFSFQTLKKLYTMLFAGKSRYLVLDSESVWIRPTIMSEEFDRFFKNPFIPFSPIENMTNQSLPRLAVENIGHLLKAEPDKWCLECFSWFYEMRILKDMCRELGSPMEMVRQVYRYDQLRGRNVGVFEILLYTLYIDSRNKKYKYEFKDTYKEITSRMSEEEFAHYSERLEQRYHGEAGYCEHMLLLLTKNNWKTLSEMCEQNGLYMLRCETDSFKTYSLQKKFFRKSHVCILAASQDNWWANPISFRGIFRDNWRKLLSGGKAEAKSVMRKVLPAYRVGVDTRNKLEASIMDMNRRFDQLSWDNIWNQACTRQGKPCPSLDLLFLQKLDVTDWLIGLLGEKEIKGKKILIAGDDYGDWGIPFLSLGASVDFLNTREETNRVIRRRFPSSRAAASLPGLGNEAAYDLVINVGVLNDQAFSNVLPEAVGAMTMVMAVKEEPDGITTEGGCERSGELDMVRTGSGTFGFCPMLPGQALNKVRFEIFEHRGD